jgi:catechol 2,3-dioxygenase-like lactoylglutathione lyase family enzyme
MFTPVALFNGFSVDDIEKAKEFYGETLGLHVGEGQMGGVTINTPNGSFWIYPKENHQPATYTTLNFVVASIDEAVDALVGKGIVFEKYEGMHQDDKGIARGKEVNMGPNIAWFKDPAGNILSVLED